MARPTASLIRRLAVGVMLTNLFVAMLAGLWLHHSKQQDQEDAAIATRNLARLLEQYIASAYGKIDLGLLAVVDQVEQQAAAGGIDAARLNSFLMRQKNRLPDALSLRVTDAQGVVRYGPGVTPEVQVNVADRAYFTLQRDHPGAGLVIAKPVFARISQAWVIPVSRRINRADGSFAGVAYANIGLEQLGKTFSAIDIGKHGVISLRDDEFGLVARQPEPESIGIGIGQKTVSTKFRELTQSGQAAGTYIAYAGTDHIERVFSYRKLASLPYYIVVGLAIDDFLAEWREEVIRVSALLLLFALVTLFLSWLLYRAWRRQIVVTEDLAEQEEKLRIVADYTYDWEYWRGPNREIQYMSPSCVSITGYSQAEFAADPGLLESIVHADDQELLHQHHVEFASPDEDSLDFRIIRRDGEVRWLAHGCRPVYGPDGQFRGRRASNRDITERKKLEQELERQAHVDYLTGLANRRHFLELAELELARALRYEKHLSVLMIDIDHFKKVNDRHGHKAGDEALRRLSEVALKVVREVDLVGRLGGEEFAILLPETDGEKAVEVAERLRNSIAAIEIGLESGAAFHFTVSIGVASLTQESADIDALLSQADQALYEAKHAGRNRVCGARCQER